jgi:hypothetical protein
VIKAPERPALETLGLKPHHWVHRVKAFSPGFAGHWCWFGAAFEESVRLDRREIPCRAMRLVALVLRDEDE